MSNGARRRAIGYSGVSETRRFFRRLEKDVRQGATKELQDAIEESADLTTRTMQSQAPYRDGDLKRSITYVMSHDGLSAVVGPGIRGLNTIRKKSGSYWNTKVNVSKATAFNRMQAYKAYWLEKGTKFMDEDHPFVQPTRDLVRDEVIGKISTAVDRLLQRARSKGRGV